ILVSTMEHHSNIVPWQLVAEQTGATVIPIPITDAGEIDLDAYHALLDDCVRVVALVHVSNSLGTVNPVKKMIADAHAAGAVVLVDGAQSGPHLRINVRELGADFYTLSCHKMYAPMGVGVLYGREELLEAMPPYHGGGDMIRTVSFEGTTYAELPGKFEAGTPNVGGVIGLGAAIDWIAHLGGGSLDIAFEALGEHEHELTAYGMTKLSSVPGLKFMGTSPTKVGILAFTLEGAHPHDIGTILDDAGVAVRAGHHCCMPLMKRFGVPATVRASLAVYNTNEDIDLLVAGVHRVSEVFG
ncbi:MAG: cysteine desulfurase, partial [Fimbriimonas sp.]